MYKTLFLILGLLFVAHSTSEISFKEGPQIAQLINTEGRLTIPCEGGSGIYLITCSNLPEGWRQIGNSLVVPKILTAKGDYQIHVRVSDTQGNSHEGQIVLNVNGLIVNIAEVIREVIQIDAEVGTETEAQVEAEAEAQVEVEVRETVKTVDYSYLYENEVGISGDHDVVPEGGYPVPSSPEGAPRTPSITPTLIQTTQATYSVERDAREITIDEVARNAAFNRQLTANKAVANLLAIIQQLTANVNSAKADILVLEKKLADADQANNACNNEVFRLVNTRTKIENAIKTRQDKIAEVEARIAELRPVIAELTRKRDALVVERTAIESEKSPNAAKLAALEEELVNCQNKKKSLEHQLVDLRNEIADVEAEIQNVREEAADAPNSINQIDEQIPIVDARIEDLKRQLAEAEAEKAQLIIDREMYVRMIEEAEAKIASLEEKLKGLINSIPSLEQQIDATQASCDKIVAQLEALRDEIAANEADYKILTEEIKVQNGLITDREDEVARLEDSISGLPAEIAILQKELNRIMTSLRRQYYICNDKAEAVRVAKQNLQAMVMKYNTESQYLIQANTNLEKARAEKEVADLAVEEIIRTTTTATLFPIVPNGLGETDVGVPAGNNPSGSALGAVDPDTEHPVIIGNLNHYLSTVFGVGYGIYPDNVAELYKVSVVTRDALTGQGATGVFNEQNYKSEYARDKNYGGLADFSCANEQNARGRGRVVSVQAGCIGVEVEDENGSSHEEILQISPCTSVNSINQGDIIVPGGELIYSGYKGEQNQNVAAQNILCV